MNAVGDKRNSIEQPIAESMQELDKDDIVELLKEDTKTVSQNTYLKEISSEDNLEISKLDDYLPIKKEVVYDSVEYWLLNFTYNKVFSLTFSQNETGKVFFYNCNETFSLTVYAFFPVILEICRNDTC